MGQTRTEDGGSADGGGGDGKAIADQRDNMRFMIHGRLTASRAELAAEKAASNRGRGRGSGPGHPPKKVGLAKSRFLGRLAGREAVDEDDDIIGDLAYRERKGESAKARKSLTFTLRAQTHIRHFGQLLFVAPFLIIGPVLFRLGKK